MAEIIRYCAPCLFGLEGLLAEEIREIGGTDVSPENGRVLFSGELSMMARANLRLRTAERVEVVLGSFSAVTFTELFDQTAVLPFERWIGKTDAFPVTGWSLKSALFSIPDCQSIIKKAAVNRLSGIYGINWFDESGPAIRIRFSILKDQVTVLLDTSGAGLHKRGYRENAAGAPIKETLAAAMVMLTRPYDDTVLYDPFCGSGTLLIEGAMYVRHIAPGLLRRFAAEHWHSVPPEIWREERASALAESRGNLPFRCVGSDIDPQAIPLTLENGAKAGIADCVSARQADIADFAPDTPRGMVITNPPYGERLLDIEAARELTRTMGRVFEKKHGWRYAVISPDERFEELFGRPADKRRKLYNGMLKCQLYLYYKS